MNDLTKNMICIVLEIPLQDSIKQSVGGSTRKGTTYKKIILSVLLKWIKYEYNHMHYNWLDSKFDWPNNNHVEEHWNCGSLYL